jgi:hypothetical protein
MEREFSVAANHPSSTLPLIKFFVEGGNTSGTTAARPPTRRTADRALSRPLERVSEVNGDARFLARVTKLVVFGSYLRADADGLSDPDIAIEPKPISG